MKKPARESSMPELSIEDRYGSDMSQIPSLDSKYISNFESDLHMSSLDFFSMHYFRIEAEKACIDLLEGTNFIKSHRLLMAIKNYYRPIKPVLHPPRNPQGVEIYDRVEQKIKNAWNFSKKIITQYKITRMVSDNDKETLYFLVDDLLDEVYWARQKVSVGIKGFVKRSKIRDVLERD